MGKPHSHAYMFQGSECSAGRMVCAKCNQPIFDHSQDWLYYVKPKGYDWAYVCFHRHCYSDQSGWVKLEKKHKAHEERNASIEAAVADLCAKFSMTQEDLYHFIQKEEWTW